MGRVQEIDSDAGRHFDGLLLRDWTRRVMTAELRPDYLLVIGEMDRSDWLGRQGC